MVDKADFEREVKSSEVCEKEASKFCEKVREKRKAIRAKAAASAPTPAGRSRRKKGPAQPRLVLPADALTQPEMKRLSPPGSYVWQNTSTQAWLGRLPPAGQVSRSWLAHGHRGSAILVLRELWSRALNLGLCDEIPVVGLEAEAAKHDPSLAAGSSVA